MSAMGWLPSRCRLCRATLATRSRSPGGVRAWCSAWMPMRPRCSRPCSRVKSRAVSVPPSGPWFPSRSRRGPGIGPARSNAEPAGNNGVPRRASGAVGGYNGVPTANNRVPADDSVVTEGQAAMDEGVPAGAGTAAVGDQSSEQAQPPTEDRERGQSPSAEQAPVARSRSRSGRRPFTPRPALTTPAICLPARTRSRAKTRRTRTRKDLPVLPPGARWAATPLSPSSLAGRPGNCLVRRPRVSPPGRPSAGFPRRATANPVPPAPALPTDVRPRARRAAR